jgi:hypothetical protein
MSLSTSGLSPDFDRNAGSLSGLIPGLIDFSSLLGDPVAGRQVLSGYTYSNESSSYNNQFGFYEVLDTAGAVEVRDPITGRLVKLLPGDLGYNNAAWLLSQDFVSEVGAVSVGARQSSDQETLTSFEVDLGRLVSGFIVPVALTSAGDIWTPFATANADRKQHFLSTGPLSWRMEDIYGLGDRDFNDLHVSLLVVSMA